jgi:hypothetical protein
MDNVFNFPKKPTSAGQAKADHDRYPPDTISQQHEWIDSMPEVEMSPEEANSICRRCGKPDYGFIHFRCETDNVRADTLEHIEKAVGEGHIERDGVDFTIWGEKYSIEEFEAAERFRRQH